MAMSESAFEPTTQCENHTWMGSRIFPRATHKNRSLFSVSTLPMTCGNDEKTDPYFFSWPDRLKVFSSTLCSRPKLRRAERGVVEQEHHLLLGGLRLHVRPLQGRGPQQEQGGRLRILTSESGRNFGARSPI